MKALRIAAGLLLAIAGGCGPVPPDRTATQDSLTSGLQAFSENRHAEAEQALSAALDTGGLSPDQVVEVYIHRAVCRAQQGNFAAAHADLDLAEQGAPNLDLVLSARSFVFDRAGNTAAAREALSKARALNPQVQVFSAAAEK